ncbi:MAG: diguanylate cyclase [Deltaproteobacteria bacterium]|nr:MAG: diguanylate cyclase [Deltaproteobacteria bacterium]
MKANTKIKAIGTVLVKGHLITLANSLQKVGQGILNRLGIHPNPPSAQAIISHQLELFLELLPDIAFILDLKGKAIYSNVKMTSFLGMDWKSLKGLDFRDFIVPEYQEKAEKVLETIFQQGEVSDTHIVIKNNLDRRFHVLISAKLIQDAAGKDIGIMGIARDITEIVKVEEKFREIFRAIPDIAYIHDLKGNLMLVSRITEKKLGYPEPMILKMNIAEVLTEDSHKTALEKLSRIRTEKKVRDIPFTLINKDGYEIPMEARAILIRLEGQDCVLGIGRDITEKLEAEEERKKAEEEILRINNVLANLYKLHQITAKTHELQNILDMTVNSAIESLPIDACAIKIFNPEIKDFEVAAKKGLGKEYSRKRTKSLTESLSWQAFEKGKIIEEYDLKSIQSMAVDDGMASGLYIPLLVAVGPGEIGKEFYDKIGVLCIYVKERYKFSEEDKRRIEMFASYIAIRIREARLYKKVEELSITDELTKVYNLRGFRRRLEEKINICQRDGRPLSLLMVDPDNFKKVNDTYGHPAGDEILEKLVRALEEAVRGVDVVARYGGDEFAIILHNTDNASIRVVAEKIRKVIEEKSFRIEGYPDHIKIKVSLGGDSFTKALFKNAARLESAEIESIIGMLVDSVDKALYQAKKQGGNRAIIRNLANSIRGE